MKQAADPILNNLKSILRLSNNEIESIVSNGNKYFLKTKNNSLKYYGGYDKYFENLSRGRYKEDSANFIKGEGGQRTLNFNVKYISTVEKILSHPRPLRILDLGCSSGFLRRVLEANVFSPQAIYYYGLDIREGVLKKAVVDVNDIETGAQGDNIPSLYLNYDMRSGLPFQDDTFDFVVSFEAIKYLKKNDAEKLFKEISRVLKKEKTFIYSTAGVFENEKIRKEVLKFRGEMVSFWSPTDLRKSLEENNLFLMKTYGSEMNYRALQSHFPSKNDPTLLRMEKLYPEELIAAVLGPFYPENNPTKLFFISKGRISLLEEVEKMFPGNEVATLKHHGNSEIFVIGQKIAKYLPRDFFKKYLTVYKILKEQTEIEVPELISVVESDISENYILVMEKNEGDLFGDIWENLSDTKKGVTLRELVSVMRQIHSIHLNFKNTQSYFKLINGVSNWQKAINDFCLSALNQCVKNNIFGKDLRSFFLSILKQNINYIPSSVRDFIHGDLNLNNLTVSKNLGITVLFDFESCQIGDKYLDLIITSANFEKKDQEALFALYGVPDNFDKIAKVYRSVLFLRSLRNKTTFKGKRSKIKEFIESGGRLSYVISL